MPPNDDFTDIWREHRAFLVDLAFRMLGNIHDAEDIVQEAFGRLLRQDRTEIDDVRGWLVVVVSRLCLDQLKLAHRRHETGATVIDTAPTTPQSAEPDPADRVSLDDSIRMALLVVLRELSPAERAVFVLHDVFQFSFDAVSTIVGRTPAACRQLASRARRRIEAETAPDRFSPSFTEQHEIAQRFIEACAGGDMNALMELLDPDVAGDVDLGAGMAVRAPQRGRAKVARGLMTYFGPTSGATTVSQPVNGQPAMLSFRNGKLSGILLMKARDGLVYDLHAIIDPAKLAFAATELDTAS